MANRWVSFVVTFSICMGSFLLFPGKTPMWLNVIVSLSVALFSTLLGSSKFFHHLIGKIARRAVARVEKK